MHNLARKVFLREIKNVKLHKKFSVSVISKKNEYIVKSPCTDVIIPKIPFMDRLWQDFAGYKNFTAIECAETKKSYTYTQLQDYIATFATSLHHKLGLKLGDVVGVMLPNMPEYAVVSFGIIQAGCVLTTINPIYKEYEVTHQTALTQPKVIVTIEECYDTVVNALKAAKVYAKIIIVDNPSEPVPNGTIRYSEIGEKGEIDYAHLSKIVKKDDDVVCIPFSSGTTGLPKGVELTHRNLVAALEMMAHELTCFPKLASGSFQDVVPCVLPFFHVYGLIIVLMGHLTKGCKMVTLKKFSASLYIDILKDYQATLIYAVPPIAMLLSKHPDVGYEHLRHVRHFSSGAAPLSSSDIEPLMEKCKGQIHIGQGFGATETCAIVTCTHIGTEPDLSASGQPFANVEIMFAKPDTEEPVPIGEQGEIYVRSPTRMKGYHKNEKATRECITDDGFFKTGDLGYYKPGVGLYINDRIKELIKVKGLQVAPAELESLLRSHPAVAEAAVIGIPHDLYGETPKAFIVTKKDHKTTEKELQEFVASKVAAYKSIEEVQFVETIPKTSSGKIMRRELKQMYA